MMTAHPSTSSRASRFVASSLLATSLAAIAACSVTTNVEKPRESARPDDAVVAPGPTDTTTTPPAPSQLIVDRPYELRVPKSYDASRQAPLVIGLHGYGPGDNAKALERWMKLAPEADARGYLYVLPSGTLDSEMNPFWNGTSACCDFDGTKVDDVKYLAAVIEDVARTHALDRKRVYVTGISGGGIMAHRLACDLSDRIAAIVSISGATWLDASKCKPTSAVSIVEMHGDRDDVVPYGGSRSIAASLPGLPSARETVDHWAAYNGCTGAIRVAGPPLDLESEVAGAETKVEKFDGCARGDVELWTAIGGGHAPLFTAQLVPTLFDYFAAHPKP